VPIEQGRDDEDLGTPHGFFDIRSCDYDEGLETRMQDKNDPKIHCLARRVSAQHKYNVRLTYAVL
jgi:hypothetical protein